MKRILCRLLLEAVMVVLVSALIAWKLNSWGLGILSAIIFFLVLGVLQDDHTPRH